jgi:hypothetical protein
MKDYRTNLALYYGNVTWKNKRLKTRLLRYMHRSIKGKSPFISTKKAINNWRQEMEKEYYNKDCF